MNCVLILEDGTTYHGKAYGKVGTVIGEVCYNTGMTGYQEIFSDPSYYQQIVVTTNVHIGNYGIKYDEQQSDSIKISGLVCKNFNEVQSRKLSDGSLNDYFIANNIVVISDVDSREIVLHVREKGAMNCIISSEELPSEELIKRLKEAPSMEGLELSSKVSTVEPYYAGEPTSTYKITVLDLGIKTNILNNFIKRDCYCKVFPAQSNAEELISWKPDGYFISNGPGDPSAMPYALKTVQSILETGTPLFGICLGHQLLAQTIGAKTYKMHTGHRGLNHPVKNLITGKSEITSQNHGFCVDSDSISTELAEITHINLNDNTVEGIRLKGKKAFSVQYHPEAAPGPHDAEYLFDDFITLIKNK